MFIEGDIFKIGNKEYRLRLINDIGGCWLEPVIYRDENVCTTGGLNKCCRYDDLNNLEYINKCY